MEKSRAADWERIEADYRVGIKTLREIAAEHGITHTSVRKRAQRDGWDRDLAAKVRAKAEALVSKKQVSKHGPKETEKAIVEANATATAAVAIRHREDQTVMLDAAMAIVREIVQAGEQADAIEEAAQLVADGADLQRVRALIDRAISIPGRSSALKAAIDSALKVIEAQRISWKLDAKAPDRNPVEDLSDEDLNARIDARLGRLPQPQPDERRITH